MVGRKATYRVQMDTIRIGLMCPNGHKNVRLAGNQNLSLMHVSDIVATRLLLTRSRARSHGAA